MSNRDRQAPLTKSPYVKEAKPPKLHGHEDSCVVKLKPWGAQTVNATHKQNVFQNGSSLIWLLPPHGKVPILIPNSMVWEPIYLQCPLGYKLYNKLPE